MTVKIRVIGTPSSVIRGETVVAVTTGVAVGQRNGQTERYRNSTCVVQYLMDTAASITNTNTILTCLS